MKLLLHICCSNCAVYPILRLRKLGVDFTGLWYNPNIHPFQEYILRLNSLKRLEDIMRFSVLYNELYDLSLFLKGAVENHESPERCSYCYRLRLEETARTAKDKGFDAFSTTLFVSPYQLFDLIVERGKELAEKYNIEFFIEDFRKGYREGMKISREMGLYRQRYCGCIFSEAERFMKKVKEPSITSLTSGVV